MRKYFSGFSLTTLLMAGVLSVGSLVAQGPPQGPPPGPPQDYPQDQQQGPPPPGQDQDHPGQPNTAPEEQPMGRSANAGGNWSVFQSEDPMTAAKLVRFELTSNNTMPNSERRSKIILLCKDGKLERATFRPSIRMAGPNRPGFWGQPQMEVRVRVDDAHSDHGWNWYGGHFLTMDKGTTRELLGAHLFRVEFLGARRQQGPAPQIADFSPEGIDLGRVKSACDLTPKRP